MQNLPVEEVDYKRFRRLHGELYQSEIIGYCYYTGYLDSGYFSPSSWIFDYSRQKFYKRFEEHLEGIDPRDFSFPLEEIKNKKKCGKKTSFLGFFTKWKKKLFKKN